MPERVAFLTSDGVEIVGTLVRAEGAKGAALLLHMMPAVRDSWGPFAAELAARGLSSLAIDLRGHGESTRQGGKTLDYRAFGDAEHQAKRLDVEAAAAFLAGQGFGLDRLAVAGASIGANLAIRFSADHPEVRACLALSPGLAYRGVTTEDAAARLSGGQALLLAASADDAYAFESIAALERAATVPADARRLKDAGHGTTMFERDAAFMKEAADWLASKLI